MGFDSSFLTGKTWRLYSKSWEHFSTIQQNVFLNNARQNRTCSCIMLHFTSTLFKLKYLFTRFGSWRDKMKTTQLHKRFQIGPASNYCSIHSLWMFAGLQSCRKKTEPCEIWVDLQAPELKGHSTMSINASTYILMHALQFTVYNMNCLN